jgi:ABC-type dipeptide/oligopeptide/nickel transport system permease subunit
LKDRARAASRPANGLRRLLRNRSVVIGLVMSLGMASVALFAPIVLPYDPMAINARLRFQPPSLDHLMGTDNFGRDIFSRVVIGARISYQVGFGGTGLSLVAGVVIGAIAGFVGGPLDRVLMRVTDAVIAFPGLLIALVLVAILGSGANTVIIAVATILVPVFIRAVRASVLVEREKLYVEAARTAGAGEAVILARHVLPNVISPILVLATSTFAISILIEASLSFLGMGAVPPDVSWGMMLNESRQYLENYPWAPFFPAAAITLAVLGLNILGDGLRDYLDPHLRHRL